MKFRPGQSGNPMGRPRGIKDRRQRYIESIEEVVPEILELIKQKALEGDTTAIKLVLERVLPLRRAEEWVVELEALRGAETLSLKAMAVINAIADGEVSTEAGANLMNSIGHLAKIIETDELCRRVEALENAQKKS